MSTIGKEAETILRLLFERRVSLAIAKVDRLWEKRDFDKWVNDREAPVLFDALVRTCGLSKTMLSDLLPELEVRCPKPRPQWTLQHWIHWQIFKSVCSFHKENYEVAKNQFLEALKLTITVW